MLWIAATLANEDVADLTVDPDAAVPRLIAAGDDVVPELAAEIPSMPAAAAGWAIVSLDRIGSPLALQALRDVRPKLSGVRGDWADAAILDLSPEPLDVVGVLSRQMGRPLSLRAIHKARELRLEIQDDPALVDVLLADDRRLGRWMKRQAPHLLPAPALLDTALFHPDAIRRDASVQLLSKHVPPGVTTKALAFRPGREQLPHLESLWNLDRGTLDAEGLLREHVSWMLDRYKHGESIERFERSARVLTSPLNRPYIPEGDVRGWLHEVAFHLSPADAQDLLTLHGLQDDRDLSGAIRHWTEPHDPVWHVVFGSHRGRSLVRGTSLRANRSTVKAVFEVHSDDVPWRGGDPFLPALDWTPREARRLTRHLLRHAEVAPDQVPEIHHMVLQGGLTSVSARVRRRLREPVARWILDHPEDVSSETRRLARRLELDAAELIAMARLHQGLLR